MKSTRALLIKLRPVAVAVCSVVVFELSAHATAVAAVGTVTSYPIPVPSGAQTVTPYAVTAAGDGRLWFIAGKGNGAFVGRMRPDGTVGPADEIVLPDAQGSQLVDLVGITVGPDSDVWASHDVGYVAHVPIAATQTSDVTDYTDFAHAPGKIVAGPDSRLWFATPGADNGAITGAGAFTFYPTGATTNAQGIAVGSDGNLWYGEAGAIGVMSPTGARLHDYPMPAGWFAVSLIKGPDGNLWGTLRASSGDQIGAIAKITPAGIVTVFRTPQDVVSQPYGIAVGPDGRLWFADRLADVIGVIPTTAVSSADITEYPLPAGTAPLGIAPGPDGRMWFAESGTGKLGAIEPQPPPTPITGQASSVGRTTATLNGTANPNGSEVTDCHFDYGTSTNYGFSVPCDPSPGAGTSPVPVSAPISALSPNATYDYRLVASGTGGTSYGNNQTLTTVPPATPRTVTTTQKWGSTQGASIAIPAGATGESDSAKLSQSGSGTVTFALYSNAQCTGPPVFSSTNPVKSVALIPGGPVDSFATSDPVTQPLTSGTYYWTAAYSDGSSDPPSTSPCGSETLTVGPTVMTTQKWGSTQGASIAIPAGATGEFDTAKLSQSGSGTVTFALYSNPQCTGPPVFSSTKPVTSVALIPGGPVDSFATSDPVTQRLPSGIYYWTAAYSDGSQPQPTMSPCGSETLTIGPTVMTTQKWGSTQGASIAIPAGATGESDSAKLSQSGSGTVTFALYSNAQCTGPPVFSSTNPVKSVALIPGGPVDSFAISDPVTQPLASGTYYWTAAYSDGSSDPPSTSPCGSETLTIGSLPRILTRSAFISVRSVTLAIRCAVLPCRLTVTLTLPAVLGASDARTRGKRKPLVITLARGTATIRKHGAQAVRLRVTIAGRRFVNSHSGRVTVIAAIAMRIGGHTTIAKQRLKIRITKTGKPPRR